MKTYPNLEVTQEQSTPYMVYHVKFRRDTEGLGMNALLDFLSDLADGKRVSPMSPYGVSFNGTLIIFRTSDEIRQWINGFGMAWTMLG